jgi:hypothetical protein
MRLYQSYFLRVFMVAIGLAVTVFAVSAGAQEDPAKSSAQTQPQSDTPAKHKIAPYALIFGTVWDSQNRPVYGVPIKIRRSDQKKAKWQVMSDHRGEFAQRVPVGKADYIVTAEIKPPKGKKKDWKAPETKAHIENDERTDVGLHLTE